eukprot:NODE_4353_length_671_cov_30.635048_g3710_i0.p2 GENE.NODE_4353_length_671_cov_30.635048_g3710_i0~~NODE_4353_length_671_cov_30.635048_g3710_i0.p2  ORF type:complete len:74 (-),score=20.16 NODE_4353_length_671_cov_30.635048_g3710_i0:47-268(-)
MVNALTDNQSTVDTFPNRCIVPFLACGDLSGYDADRSYAVAHDHKSLEPVQPPTNPPYKEALERSHKPKASHD